MKKHGYLLIDGSNIGYAATSSSVLTVGGEQTQGIYGFLRTLRPTIATFSMLKPIMLWDGASWRKNYFADYKANRDKPPETKSEIKQAGIRAEFKRQRKLMVRACELLGVTQMQAMNLEADDLAGMLVKRWGGADAKILMVSGDKDWIQLVGKGVGWFDPIRDERIFVSKIREKLGVEDARAFLDVKCLMGDNSDNVPGVGGIGEKGAVELVNTYGSVQNFINQVLDKSIDASALPKKFRDFALSEDKQLAFKRNQVLMDLNSPSVPRPRDLRVTAGEFDIEAFGDFCRTYAFKSILTDLEGWCQPFNPAREMAEAA